MHGSAGRQPCQPRPGVHTRGGARAGAEGHADGQSVRKIAAVPASVDGLRAFLSGPDRRRRLTAVVLLLAVCAAASSMLSAHGVSSKDARYLLTLNGPAPIPLMYLGAKHMVTGYDHLLFLVGVIFFLYRLKDVLLYVSLFTIGHSVTLLAGVLGGIHANPYLIDAIIGFSVVYKAFENMDGFRRVF